MSAAVRVKTLDTLGVLRELTRALAALPASLVAAGHRAAALQREQVAAIESATGVAQEASRMEQEAQEQAARERLEAALAVGAISKESICLEPAPHALAAAEEEKNELSRTPTEPWQELCFHHAAFPHVLAVFETCTFPPHSALAAANGVRMEQRAGNDAPARPPQLQQLYALAAGTEPLQQERWTLALAHILRDVVEVASPELAAMVEKAYGHVEVHIRPTAEPASQATPRRPRAQSALASPSAPEAARTASARRGSTLVTMLSPRSRRGARTPGTPAVTGTPGGSAARHRSRTKAERERGSLGGWRNRRVFQAVTQRTKSSVDHYTVVAHLQSLAPDDYERARICATALGSAPRSAVVAALARITE